LIIGERSRRGRGYATEAIGIVARIAFDVLKLHKLTAGVMAGNDPSLAAFRKNGFATEGVRRKHDLVDGVWRDVTMLGLLVDDLGDA
jgi:ribosomal-protein-alanine N-acetyltransferase